MVALIDFDSILYKAVYRIVSFSQMRTALAQYDKEKARQWFLEEVYNEGINRCENMVLEMQNYVNDVFFEEITSYELFITTCSKSFRNEIYPEYKANRKRNPYVWMLREHYRNNGAFCSDTHEADDLIAERAKTLGIGNYIIFSMDKDLRQLGGHQWSYYKTKSKDVQGNFIEDEYGNHVSEYKQRNVDFIDEETANMFFWKQMLTGDHGDNIKGLHRVGDKTADKILSKSDRCHISVMREYIKRGQKNDFYVNYKLLKLN